MTFPASAEGVFAIGNVDPYGSFAEHSNYGEKTDFVINGQFAALPMHDDPEKYRSMKGTSVSSARSSGKIAHLLNKDPNLNKKQIEQIMSECSQAVSYKEREFGFVGI